MLEMPISFDHLRAAKTAAVRRIKKVWLYLAIMFGLMSVLSYVMTGSSRAILVVGIVCVALGGLGSLMAAVSFRDASRSRPV